MHLGRKEERHNHPCQYCKYHRDKNNKYRINDKKDKWRRFHRSNVGENMNCNMNSIRIISHRNISVSKSNTQTNIRGEPLTFVDRSFFYKGNATNGFYKEDDKHRTVNSVETFMKLMKEEPDFEENINLQRRKTNRLFDSLGNYQLDSYNNSREERNIYSNNNGPIYQSVIYNRIKSPQKSIHSSNNLIDALQSNYSKRTRFNSSNTNCSSENLRSATDNNKTIYMNKNNHKELNLILPKLFPNHNRMFDPSTVPSLPIRVASVPFKLFDDYDKYCQEKNKKFEQTLFQ